MDDTFATVMERAATWFERARSADWLEDADLAQFQAVERRNPADLFADDGVRPLVVAFFGGTGVGKSSLLNRLAGEAVARVGVERPTSHEVTLYLHQAVELATLPEPFPVERVRIERHGDDRRRNVLWIDMPDIDSTAAENRELALEWLPHIDLLVYVVSPERYRDDAGWRVLRSRGHRHGWLFVMNRWDEGDPRQVADFTEELHDAGFEAPLVLHTSCAPAGTVEGDDEFARLEERIRALLDAHGLRELERLGYRARSRELYRAVAAAGARFGDVAVWEELRRRLEQEWQVAHDGAVEGLAWPVQEVAAVIALRQAELRDSTRHVMGKVLHRLLGRAGSRSSDKESSERTGSIGELCRLAGGLWDSGAQARLTRGLDAVEIEARRFRVAATPLCSRLQQVIDTAPETVTRSIQEELPRALARPGTPLQRLGRRAAAIAMAVLPLVALVRIALDVVVGYGRGLAGDAPFLGFDFAAHALLLLATAWLIPFALHRLFRPDLRRTAERGLTTGLDAGLDAVGRDLDDAFDRLEEERRPLVVEMERLLVAIAAQVKAPRGAVDPVLRPLLAATPPMK